VNEADPYARDALSPTKRTANQQEDVMKYAKLFASLVFFFPVTLIAQTQHITVSEPFNKMDSSVYAQVQPNIIPPTAEINNGAQGAEGIMKALKALITKKDTKDLMTDDFNLELFENKDFYCIFHILRWANADDAGKQTIQAQRWYLYHEGKLTLGSSTTVPRLFGVGRVTFLFIHLNKASKNAYKPLYEFDVDKKMPAYIAHFLGLTGLFSSNASKEAMAKDEEPPSNWWGVTTMMLQYKTSDITATAKLTRETAVEDLGDPQKFDNEGKYFVDFSVGVPIRKISQLNFDSTNNTVTAKEVDKTDILAFVNFYPRPVDIRSNTVNLIPHFVGGVAIAKQPLHKIFVGTGFGPVVANFYIGALFVKQEQLATLKPGDPATAAQVNGDLRRRYKAQLAFGLNVPVGAIIEKLKGK
jgi:hypothetical protein